MTPEVICDIGERIVVDVGVTVAYCDVCVGEAVSVGDVCDRVVVHLVTRVWTCVQRNPDGYRAVVRQLYVIDRVVTDDGVLSIRLDINGFSFDSVDPFPLITW